VIITGATLLADAYGKYAVGHYSVNNLEQVLAVLKGNEAAQAPFFLAFSKSSFNYGSEVMAEAIARAAGALYPNLAFAVHLDHGDEPTCHAAIDSGVFTSVMIDASSLPFAQNVSTTRRVVRHAHALGISVEAEIGALMGVEDHISVDEQGARLTDPREAAEFAKASGCDSLAVAVGTVHGPNKFKAGQGINFERLQQIHEAVPGLPLVLHGSSSLPAAEIARINAAGGQVNPNTRGTMPEDMRKAVPCGVAKINIDADARLVWTRVHREYFRDHPENIDFRKPGKAYIEAFAALVQSRSAELGSASRLGQLLPVIQGR
jgi:fructose-bisphosphate aldolase class II